MNPKKQRITRKYYLPSPTYWPLIGTLGLFCLALSIATLVHHDCIGPYLFIAGALLLTYMMFGWFSAVIDESIHGLHSHQMDRTYRWGMVWFIASEIAFFGIFFGALLYVRLFVVPVLGGEENPVSTHQILWPSFKAIWPLLINPNPTQFPGPQQPMAAWGIPALNTLILLSSALTVTWGHWSLRNNSRRQMILALVITILLGICFLGLQTHEYLLAYLHYNLTLKSGIYGSTFFMLTGFHAAHVTIGLTILTIILFRCFKGHFLPEHHFAFEAASWYWHFVDVVWLMLFVFVYWF